MHGETTHAISARSTSEPPRTRRGSITVITGCMFSGKTSELIRVLTALPAERIRAFKHTADHRYLRGAIVSHDGAQLPAIPIATPTQVWPHITLGTRVVGVDEAHFFDVSLLDTLKRLAAEGIDAIVTGLDLSSWGRPFPVVEALRAAADRTIQHTARCARCGATAERTQRLTPIVGGRMIGGAESYEPRCIACWRPPPESPVDGPAK